MRYLLAAVILASMSIACYGQKDPIKFGDIPMEDLQMARYDQDTSAVILVDYGEARFSPFQGKILFERHTRIKILKPEGTSWADVGVDLYHDGSSSESISG